MKSTSNKLSNAGPGSLPSTAIEILCQEGLDKALSRALDVIMNTQPNNRGKAVLEVLKDLGKPSGDQFDMTKPGKGTRFARNIIWATVASLTDYRDKISFYKSIPCFGPPYGAELSFTAASLALDTWVEGDAVFPLHVEVFSYLFQISTAATVRKIAEYWHLENENPEQVARFFSEKCKQISSTSSGSMIAAVIDDVEKKIAQSGHHKAAYADFYVAGPDRPAFCVIVDELSHKRVSSLNCFEKMRFIAEGRGVQQV